MMSLISRWLPEPNSTIFLTSAKWSAMCHSGHATLTPGLLTPGLRSKLREITPEQIIMNQIVGVALLSILPQNRTKNNDAF